MAGSRDDSIVMSRLGGSCPADCNVLSAVGRQVCSGQPRIKLTPTGSWCTPSRLTLRHRYLKPIAAGIRFKPAFEHSMSLINKHIKKTLFSSEQGPRACLCLYAGSLVIFISKIEIEHGSHRADWSHGRNGVLIDQLLLVVHLHYHGKIIESLHHSFVLNAIHQVDGDRGLIFPDLVL